MNYIKNSLKLFLLGLITPLLVNFTNAFDLTADEVSYIDSHSLTKGSFNNVSHYSLFDQGSNEGIGVCVIFSGFTVNVSPWFAIITDSSPDTSSYYGSINGATTPYFLFCSYMDYRYLNLVPDRNKTNQRFSTDTYWVVSPNVIFNGYLGFDVQSLLDNYNQCSDNLDQCDTSVQQCQLDKESLSGSLASCTANNDSLQNNIDSLTLQLQNCLGQSCEGSGDIGSGNYFNQYSLYRTDDEIDYSTPIINNLFLPLGYKGKINEDNILTISKINTLETAYQFDDTDKTTVINSMSLVMLFFLGTGLLIVVIMYLRRFITKK